MENEPNHLQGLLWASNGVMKGKAGDSQGPRQGRRGSGRWARVIQWRPGTQGAGARCWVPGRGLGIPASSTCRTKAALPLQHAPGLGLLRLLTGFSSFLTPGPEQHVRGVPGGEQLPPLHHLPHLRPREGRHSHPGGHPPGLRDRGALRLRRKAPFTILLARWWGGFQVMWGWEIDTIPLNSTSSHPSLWIWLTELWQGLG